MLTLIMQGHHYNIYPEPEYPLIDAYQHLSNWKHWYEQHLMKGGVVLPSHVIFPQISLATNLILPATIMSSENVQKMIDMFTQNASLCHGGSCYTTHTFCRGGAQYYFMFCKPGDRMSLSMVRWWGGWADGEKVSCTLESLIRPSLTSFPE